MIQMIKRDKVPYLFRPIIGGITATFGSFLFVSIEISIVASILTFKGRGVLDQSKLDPYIDMLIKFTGMPSSIIITAIIAMILTNKWSQATHLDHFILASSSSFSGLWLGNHFEQIQIDTTSILNFILCYAAIIIGSQLAPYYQKWVNSKKTKKIDRYLKTYHLTNREKEIVMELLKGHSNKEIGRNLFIEEGTVKQHLKIIFKKTNCKSRVNLISKLNKKKIYSN